MADMIRQVEIPGAAVYGVKQTSYTVDGTAGQDFATALAAASFKQSAAIEAATGSYAAVVRQRVAKLKVLGEVMANINMAIATLKTKNPTSEDMAEHSFGPKLCAKAAQYGIDLDGNEIHNVTVTYSRAGLYRLQNEVQYAMDREDNDLKQDMVGLQSLVSKRDNAFSTAAKVVKKALGAASSTIQNIGE